MRFSLNKGEFVSELHAGNDPDEYCKTAKNSVTPTDPNDPSDDVVFYVEAIDTAGNWAADYDNWDVVDVPF
jgi:hypothetical protein